VHISVAICTWNRCGLLRQTLQRLTEIAVPPGFQWEVMVVNNNSSDATNEVAAAFSGVLPLRLLEERRPGTSYARNLALSDAEGDYLAFIDDDVLVADQWLAALHDAATRHPGVQAFSGPIEPWFTTAPDPELMAAFPALANGFCGLDYGPAEIRLRPGQPLFTANLAIARRAAEGLRFNPALGGTAGSGVCGEDVDFMARLAARGGTVVWIPQMGVKHYVDPSRMTLEYLTRFYYDRGRTVVRRGDGAGVPQLMGAPRWCWRALVQHYTCYTALRATPLRRHALASLREYQYARGVIAESLAQRRDAPRRSYQGVCS
jgi:glycosyltransferase involved in cell wall biosynthesis